MKLSSIIALLLAMLATPALAQTSPGTSPLSGSKGGTNNAFMQFTGPSTSIKTYTLPNASDTIVTLTATQALTNKTINGNTITASSGTLTLAAGKTLGISNSMTFAGTDSTTITFQGTDTYVGRTTTDTLTNKTLGAVTLSGTVSGGGNNVNNVVIGSVTPLAGGFTTVSANSVTAALRYGGSATGSTALLNGTSSGSPSSAFLNLQSNGQFTSIGNTSPKAYLDINENLSSSPALVEATSLQRWQAANATNGGVEFVTFRDAAGAGNLLTGVVSAGTSGSPAVTANQLNMFNLSGWSYNGTAFAKGAIIALRTDSQWSGTNQASAIDFYTTPTTSTTLTRQMILQPSGGLSLGTTTDPGVGNIRANRMLQTGVTTVGSLPTCNAGAQAARYFVTDSNSVAFWAVPAGGAANIIVVTCDGTNWRVG